MAFAHCSFHRMVRPRLTIYVCQESQQLRDLQQKHEDGDTVTSTFFGKGFKAWLGARGLAVAADRVRGKRTARGFSKQKCSGRLFPAPPLLPTGTSHQLPLIPSSLHHCLVGFGLAKGPSHSQGCLCYQSQLKEGLWLLFSAAMPCVGCCHPHLLTVRRQRAHV